MVVYLIVSRSLQNYAFKCPFRVVTWSTALDVLCVEKMQLRTPFLLLSRTCKTTATCLPSKAFCDIQSHLISEQNRSKYSCLAQNSLVPKFPFLPLMAMTWLPDETPLLVSNGRNKAS